MTGHHFTDPVTVRNQDPGRPMFGSIIDAPQGQTETDDWVWVRWESDYVCQEYDSDITIVVEVDQA